MAAALSAGILLYRRENGCLEVLIAHPGGPFWAGKDAGAWSIPKGGVEPGEDVLQAARREFTEELGHAPPDAVPIDLGEVRLRSGKVIRGFALAGDFDPASIASNLVELSWPPRTGKIQLIPEIDRAQWCTPEVAAEKLNPAQVEFVDRLRTALS